MVMGFVDLMISLCGTKEKKGRVPSACAIHFYTTEIDDSFFFSLIPDSLFDRTYFDAQYNLGVCVQYERTSDSILLNKNVQHD